MTGTPGIQLIDVYEGGHAAEDKVRFLYELLRERPREANISHSELPAFHVHRHFVRERPYRAWYIVANEAGRFVGCVYATMMNEVGIFILRAHQRRGYARAAVVALRERLEPLASAESLRRGRWLAHVAPDNQASHALFRALGAQVIQVTYLLP